MHRLESRKNIIALIILLISISILSYIYYFFPLSCTFSQLEDENSLKAEIEKMYNTRSSSFVSGDLASLKQLFDTSQKYGQWSLEHEVRRVKYLKDWSSQRKIKFINVESFIRIKKVYNRNPVTKVALEESYKFDYIYTNDAVPIINSFGVGIRHTLSLIKKEDSHVIYSDWYTDCFEDAMGAYSGEIGNGIVSSDEDTNSGVFSQNISVTRLYYNRQKAVEYADKYCGAAWGSGNNFKYNKKYSDYNGQGGDCTNFASQVLGDSDGGSLPQDGTWRCSGPKYGRCSGSRAWVNVDGLKSYLLYSGKGSQIAVGTYKDLTTPAQNKPNSAISKLQPGDVICYIKKGNPDHFGIVTALDSHGYPLINSHTTDRYHVPWDLGWGDKHIKFCLIHING